MLPVFAVLAACVPLTNRRTAVPSYVSARCTQVFVDSVVVANASPYVPPMIPPPAGRLFGAELAER